MICPVTLLYTPGVGPYAKTETATRIKTAKTARLFIVATPQGLNAIRLSTKFSFYSYLAFKAPHVVVLTAIVGSIITTPSLVVWVIG